MGDRITVGLNIQNNRQSVLYLNLVKYLADEVGVRVGECGDVSGGEGLHDGVEQNRKSATIIAVSLHCTPEYLNSGTAAVNSTNPVPGRREQVEVCLLRDLRQRVRGNGGNTTQRMG